MLMKKEVIEDNENLKKEIKDLKKQLEEEKNAYNRMYNMYVEKDNIIEELEKWIDEEILDYDKNIHFSKVHKVPIVEYYEREKICFRDFKDKIKELKGEDKDC